MMDELESLKRRLDVLEKKNRWWQTIGACSVGVAAALILMAATTGTEKRVRTQSLVITDANDNARIVMGVLESGTVSMTYSTPEGKSCGWLDAAANGKMDFQMLYPETRHASVQIDPDGISFFNRNPNTKLKYSGMIQSFGDGTATISLIKKSGEVWTAPAKVD